MRSRRLFVAFGAAFGFGAVAAAIVLSPRAYGRSQFTALTLALTSAAGLIVFLTAAISFIAWARVDDSRHPRIRDHVWALAIAAIGALVFFALSDLVLYGFDPCATDCD